MTTLSVHFHLKTAETAINPYLLPDLDLPPLTDAFEQRLAYDRLLKMVQRLNREGLIVEAGEVQAQALDLAYPSALSIDVLLLPWEWREEISSLFFPSGQPPLGFHAQTTGEELLGQGYFNPRHQVVMFVPSNHDLENLLEQTMEDGGLQHMEDAERLFYNTLTHEISHVLLFAEASGGMSSHEIDVAFDAGAFPFDRHAVSTGRELKRLADHYAHCMDEAEEVEAMEELVETQGYALLNLLSSPPKQELKRRAPKP